MRINFMITCANNKNNIPIELESAEKIIRKLQERDIVRVNTFTASDVEISHVYYEFDIDQFVKFALESGSMEQKLDPLIQDEICHQIERIYSLLDYRLHPIVSPERQNVYYNLYDEIEKLERMLKWHGVIK